MIGSYLNYYICDLLFQNKLIPLQFNNFIFKLNMAHVTFSLVPLSNHFKIQAFEKGIPSHATY